MNFFSFAADLVKQVFSLSRSICIRRVQLTLIVFGLFMLRLFVNAFVFVCIMSRKGTTARCGALSLFFLGISPTCCLIATSILKFPFSIFLLALSFFAFFNESCFLSRSLSRSGTPFFFSFSMFATDQYSQLTRRHPKKIRIIIKENGLLCGLTCVPRALFLKQRSKESSGEQLRTGRGARCSVCALWCT